MAGYISRIADAQLKDKLDAFGAVNIVGPKWCGKTRTAEQQCKSSLYMQSNPDKESLRMTASINPSALLKGDRPRLIDEWQDAKEIWDAVRFECDHSDGPGQFILTGSTSKKVETSHTGTGRISEILMYPMSLYESKESDGSVSLMSIIDGDGIPSGCSSNLSVDDLVFAACRGGWPYAMSLESKRSQLMIAKDYCKQIYTRDMFSVDGVKRNPQLMSSILRSYARNISTLAKTSSILEDVNATSGVTRDTLDDYLDVLRKLYVVQEMDGWTPSLRSSAGIRSGPKRELVDPSIAVAAMGTSPEKLSVDMKTFGFIFECLCVRDLRVYSSAMGGEMSHYRDRYGLEADGVLHLDDGRYVLLEFKTGTKEIEDGANHMVKLEELIKEHNKVEKQVPLDLPSAKIVVTGSKYGYERPDGVYVVPIGCLGP